MTPTLPLIQGWARSQCDGTLGVADDLCVGNAAVGAHLGRDIVGFAVAGAVIEVVADRSIAVMGELAGRLTIPFVPAGR